MKQWEVVEGASWAEGGMLPLPSRLGWRGCLGGELEQRWEMVKTEVESETPGVGGGHGVEGDRVVEFASFQFTCEQMTKICWTGGYVAWRAATR